MEKAHARKRLNSYNRDPLGVADVLYSVGSDEGNKAQTAWLWGGQNYMLCREVGQTEKDMRKNANRAATAIAVALMVVGALFTTTTALARSQQTCMIVAYVCTDAGCKMDETITVETGVDMVYKVALTGAEWYLLVEQRCTGGTAPAKLVLKYTAPGGSQEIVPIDDGRGVRAVIVRGTAGPKPGEAGPVEVHTFDLCGGVTQRAVFKVTKTVPAEPPREPTIEEKLEAAREAEKEAKRFLAEKRAALKGLQGARLKQAEKEAERAEAAALLAQAEAERQRAEAAALAEEMGEPEPGDKPGKRARTLEGFGGSLTIRGVGFFGTNEGFGGDVRGLWHIINPPESGGWGVASGLRGRFLQTSKEVMNAPGGDVWATSRNYTGEVQLLAIARASEYVLFMFGLTGLGGGVEWQEATDGRNPRTAGIFSLNGGAEVHFLFGGGALALTLALEGGGLWGSPPEINGDKDDKAVGTFGGDLGVAYHF